MRVRVPLLCLTAIVTLGAAVARAQEGEPACLKEIQRLCPLVPTGLSQACLQSHLSELSPECRKHVGQVNEAIDRLGRDCAADAERFCAGPQTRAGQRAACLLQHRDALSAACREALDATAER